MLLCPETIRSLLLYDPGTGKLTWERREPSMFIDHGGHSPEHQCSRWNGSFALTEAFTCLTNTGYKHGRIFGKGYLAHRVIWALWNGEWPNTDIDHRDRDKTNNRIDNLRLATKSLNGANMSHIQGGTSRFRGVCWSKVAKKWISYITHQQKRHYLGTFIDEVQAARAYDAAAKKAFGPFANLNFQEKEHAGQ